MKSVLIGMAVLAISGCATKQYPQLSHLTPEESSVYDCKYTEMELAKAQGAKKDILETGRFNGKTVLGFLGDFGIGNGMAKRNALKGANDRIAELELLKLAKCSNKTDS